MTSWEAPISPNGCLSRKGLRRRRLATEANLDGSLSLDLRLSAVGIGGDDDQRVLEWYAARDVAKAHVDLATDHILYNSTTGTLSCDPDRTGIAAAVQVAIDRPV